MVCAWPEPPFASIAGVCDGMEALALVGAITETKSKLLRRGRIGRGEGERRSLYPSRPPRLERDQQAGSTGRDAPEANARRVTKSKILGIIIGIAIVILILAWKWGLFELQAIANKGYAGWIGVIPSASVLSQS